MATEPLGGVAAAPRGRIGATALIFCAALTLAAAAPARAESLQFCAPTPVRSAAEQSRLLRLTAVVREVLEGEGAGARAVLVSRAGQRALARFDQRYSHMGVALAAHPQAPWTVRQLYFDCEAPGGGAARLFDEGLAGFVMGLDDPRHGHLSLVLLPETEAVALEARAMDRDQALALVGGAYSANAYPFDTRYQNCNQWVAELLASAWGRLSPEAAARDGAQAWLRREGYEPTTLRIASPLWLLAAAFVPWVHTDDHPREDLDALRVRLSLPASIEGFVRRRVPAAERIELCTTEDAVVVRRGWTPMGPDCAPEPGDRVHRLD